MATYGGNSTIIEIVRASTGNLGSNNGIVTANQVLYTFGSSDGAYALFYPTGFYNTLSGAFSLTVTMQAQGVNAVNWYNFGGSGTISGTGTASSEVTLGFSGELSTGYNALQNTYNNTGSRLQPQPFKMLPNTRILLNSGTVPNGSSFRLSYFVEIHKNS